MCLNAFGIASSPVRSRGRFPINVIRTLFDTYRGSSIHSIRVFHVWFSSDKSWLPEFVCGSDFE